MIYILVSERSLFCGLLQRQWRGGRPTHHASQHRKLRRTVVVRRLKGSTDSSHYHDPTLDWVCPGQPRHGHAAAAALPRPRLDQQHGEVLERDELAGLKRLQRDGAKAAYVFVNERGQPFGRMGIGRMIERAGEAAKLPFPVHVHYTAMSPEPFRDIWRIAPR